MHLDEYLKRVDFSNNERSKSTSNKITYYASAGEDIKVTELPDVDSDVKDILGETQTNKARKEQEKINNPEKFIDKVNEGIDHKIESAEILAWSSKRLSTSWVNQLDRESKQNTSEMVYSDICDLHNMMESVEVGSITGNCVKELCDGLYDYLSSHLSRLFNNPNIAYDINVCNQLGFNELDTETIDASNDLTSSLLQVKGYLNENPDNVEVIDGKECTVIPHDMYVSVNEQFSNLVKSVATWCFGVELMNSFSNVVTFSDKNFTLNKEFVSEPKDYLSLSLSSKKRVDNKIKLSAMRFGHINQSNKSYLFASKKDDESTYVDTEATDMTDAIRSQDEYYFGLFEEMPNDLKCAISTFSKTSPELSLEKFASCDAYSNVSKVYSETFISEGLKTYSKMKDLYARASGFSKLNPIFKDLK